MGGELAPSAWWSAGSSTLKLFFQEQNGRYYQVLEFCAISVQNRARRGQPQRAATETQGFTRAKLARK